MIHIKEILFNNHGLFYVNHQNTKKNITSILRHQKWFPLLIHSVSMHINGLKYSNMYIQSTLRILIDVHARLFILRKKSSLHVLIKSLHDYSFFWKSLWKVSFLPKKGTETQIFCYPTWLFGPARLFDFTKWPSLHANSRPHVY